MVQQGRPGIRCAVLALAVPPPVQNRRLFVVAGQVGVVGAVEGRVQGWIVVVRDGLDGQGGGGGPPPVRADHAEKVAAHQ